MPEIIERSDVRMLEQAVRHRWQLPEQLYAALPNQMLKLLVNGTPREQIAAARVLAMIDAANNAPTVRQAPVVNVGVQVNGNPDSGRTLASTIVQRLRAGSVPAVNS